MIRTATKPNPRAGRGDALAALRDDPAFRAADPAAQELLLWLLENGEYGESDTDRCDADASEVK